MHHAAGERFEEIQDAAASLLQTFEVVARRSSFTLAADELCLTQSAVSRQIKALEDQLGLPLFRRLHRVIELTADGRRLSNP